MKLRVAAFAAALALFAPVAPVTAASIVTYDEVTAGLQKGDILLVDVREADEFAAGHVPGAVNMPLSRLDAKAVPRPADKTVVVMCRSGNRSGKAAALLAAAGRGDVVDYSGSMIDWSRRGGTIVQGQ